MSGSPLSLVVNELVDAIAERVVDRLAERPPTQTEPTPWLDVGAAARYLACESHRIYDLVSAGRLHCARDGRRLLFRREWLDEALVDGSTDR